MHYFKPLDHTDLPSILAIEEATQLYPWSPTLLEESLASPYSAIGIIIQQSLVGYVMFSTLPPEAEILNVCVDQKFQGQGYGRALLQQLMEQLKSQAIKQVFLEVRASNWTAIHLYKTLGFTQINIRRSYYKTLTGREDALLFQLDLDRLT